MAYFFCLQITTAQCYEITYHYNWILVLQYFSNSYIYWVDCCRTPKIERSRLDGAEREKLFSNRKKIPNGLALDESGGKLYWAGTDVNEYGIIGVITLSDLSSKVIFQRTGYLPYGLDVFEGYAYWTDQKKEAVLRINNNNSVTEEKIIFPDLNKPNGMKIRARREKRPGRKQPLYISFYGTFFTHYIKRSVVGSSIFQTLKYA